MEVLDSWPQEFSFAGHLVMLISVATTYLTARHLIINIAIINMLMEKMPHFHIEYSANLEDVIDMHALCDVLRAEAANMETFPMPGIRVRAIRVDHCSIADGNTAHGFIDLSVRLREGRPMDVKREAIERIFESLKNYVEPALTNHSIALSAEMRDIDAALSPKFGNIRDHLGDSA